MAKTSFRKSRSILSLVFSAFMIMVSSQSVAPAFAQTIVDDWSKVQAPKPPELKTVTLDPKTTALLVLDL